MWHSGAAGIRHAVKTGWATRLPSASPLPEPWVKPEYATCADVIRIRAAPFSSNKEEECERGMETGRCGKTVRQEQVCEDVCHPCLSCTEALNSTLSVRPAEGTQGQGADLTLTGPRCILVSPSITALQLLLTHGLLSQPDCVRQHTLCEQAGFRRTRQRGSDELTGRVINPFNPTGHNSDCKKGFHL